LYYKQLFESDLYFYTVGSVTVEGKDGPSLRVRSGAETQGPWYETLMWCLEKMDYDPKQAHMSYARLTLSAGVGWTREPLHTCLLRRRAGGFETMPPGENKETATDRKFPSTSKKHDRTK